MKWMSVYLLGFVLVMTGVGLSLWKWGIWARIDPTWRWIIVLIMLGIGMMIAVANSGRKESIEIDSK